MLVPNRHESTDTYRYGFQGQEKDDEIKGEGNSLNYTFRMHDPRAGRFFAIDPLTKSYPFYSPYTFSGNRVLDSRELEGLEPESVVSKDGKLTRAMIGLLNGAFAFDKIKIQNTTWISSKSPNITTFQKTVYNFQEPTAISFYGKVVFDDKVKDYSKSFWIKLVAHEQSHHDDMNNEGETSFASKYLLSDSWQYKYRSIPTEVKAYKIEEEYMPLLLEYKNGAVLDLFDPQKNSYTDNEKEAVLERIGTEFRINVILQNEINKNNLEIKSYKSISDTLRKEANRKGENQNSSKILMYDGFVNSLEKRNKSLKKEQDGLKKKL